MKTLLKSVAFGLLAVGAAVGIAGFVFAPWWAAGVYGLSAFGCALGMAELFGFDVG